MYFHIVCSFTLATSPSHCMCAIVIRQRMRSKALTKHYTVPLQELRVLGRGGFGVVVQASLSRHPDVAESSDMVQTCLSTDARSGYFASPTRTCIVQRPCWMIKHMVPHHVGAIQRGVRRTLCRRYSNVECRDDANNCMFNVILCKHRRSIGWMGGHML